MMTTSIKLDHLEVLVSSGFTSVITELFEVFGWKKGVFRHDRNGMTVLIRESENRGSSEIELRETDDLIVSTSTSLVFRTYDVAKVLARIWSWGKQHDIDCVFKEIKEGSKGGSIVTLDIIGAPLKIIKA